MQVRKTLRAVLTSLVAGLMTIAVTNTSYGQLVVSEEAFEYDLNGNIEKITTPRGHEINFEYDKANRMTKRFFPDGSEVIYQYDANGNRTFMQDQHGAYAYAYDPFDRLAVYLFQPNSASTAVQINYEYDFVGNLVRVVYPSGREIAYTYDGDNRLTTVDTGEGVVQYDYDQIANRLEKITLPNGVTTEYIYDASRRISRVISKEPDDSLISSYDYAYDANDNRTQIIEVASSGSITIDYQYDPINRLTRTDYSDGTFEAYQYDTLGNRLSKETQDGTIVYEYDQDNRLLIAGGIFFVYDKAGNLKKRLASDKIETYEYDFLNRLIRYEKDVTDGSEPDQLVEYEYDGDGNRISKAVNGVKTYFINELRGTFVQVALEATEQFILKKEYTYGIGRIAQTVGGTEDYYIYNYPGRSVVQLVDENLTLKGSYRYDSFGGELVNTGLGTDTFRYVAESTEIESSLVFLRARYYDPEIGRFIKKDPIGLDGGKNVYLYANGNPILYSDPEGEIPVPIVAAIVGGLIGAAAGGFNADSGDNFLAELGRGFVIGAATGFLGGVGAFGSAPASLALSGGSRFGGVIGANAGAITGNAITGLDIVGQAEGGVCQ